MKIFGLRPQTDTYIEVDLDEEWVLPSALPYSKVKFTNIFAFYYHNCFMYMYVHCVLTWKHVIHVFYIKFTG